MIKTIFLDAQDYINLAEPVANREAYYNEACAFLKNLRQSGKIQFAISAEIIAELSQTIYQDSQQARVSLLSDVICPRPLVTPMQLLQAEIRYIYEERAPSIDDLFATGLPIPEKPTGHSLHECVYSLISDLDQFGISKNAQPEEIYKEVSRCFDEIIREEFFTGQDIAIYECSCIMILSRFITCMIIKKLLNQLGSSLSESRSTTSDALHCVYAPYVDFFRADKRFSKFIREANLLNSDLVYNKFDILMEKLAKL